MVTFAQAQERAERWINGGVAAGRTREIRVREFDLGFVVWSEPRPEGPGAAGHDVDDVDDVDDSGAVRVVIARDTGEATLWPALPVGELIRRYEEEYGAAPADAAPPAAPPRRIDLEATSFLLSPPQWLQDAADAMGIPDRRSTAGASPARQEAAPGGPGPRPDLRDAYPAPAAGPQDAVPGPSAAGHGQPQDRRPAADAAGPGTAPAGADTPSAPNDALPGRPADGWGTGGGWAGKTVRDSGEGHVAVPETVFAPPVRAAGSEAKTELMPGGSALPRTMVAPPATPPGVPHTIGGSPYPPPGGASVPLPPPGAADIADAPTARAVPGSVPPPPPAGNGGPAGLSTPPPGPGAPPPVTPASGRTDDPHYAATMLADPAGGPGMPPPPPGSGPTAPVTPPPGPGHDDPHYAATMLADPAGGPGMPPPAGHGTGPTPPPPGPGTPPPPRPLSSGTNDPHYAATMLASPGDGPSMAPPPPPPAPGGGSVPPPPPAGQGAGPAAPPPAGPPPGAPNDPHYAATVLASPAGGPGVVPPPPPPPAPGARPGVPRPQASGRNDAPYAPTVLPGPPPGPAMAPPPPPPGAGMRPGMAPPAGPAYGYPQPGGVPTVGPGYMAVLRYRAQDGTEQQLIRRSAPGTPHPEWQLLHELGGLGVRPEQVLELHTELESCDLPGGYCTRMIRETWPQVRVSHTAPYGRDHASRRQGIQHLLTHQGELHQVAGAPARPAPQRVPMPDPHTVPRVPPVPLEVIGQEIAGAFGPQGVFRFDQRAVSRQGVPEIVAQTLVWAGLPVAFGPFFWAQAQPGRPVPTLAELAAQRGVQPAADAGSYLVMGHDYGRQLCVQYGTAHIVALPMEAGPGGTPAAPPQFVNSSLPEFARCLALLGRMWRLRAGLTPEQAGRWTVDFQAQLAAQDPAAIAAPDNWWAVLIEQMWDGLL